VSDIYLELYRDSISIKECTEELYDKYNKFISNTIYDTIKYDKDALLEYIEQVNIYAKEMSVIREKLKTQMYVNHILNKKYIDLHSKLYDSN
jgi:predicted DNA-binding protein YlxM (UPF0122 family)